MLKLYFLQAYDVGIAFTQQSLKPWQPGRPCQCVFGAMLKIGPGAARNANVTVCEYVQGQDCYALCSRGHDFKQSTTPISANFFAKCEGNASEPGYRSTKTGEFSSKSSGSAAQLSNNPLQGAEEGRQDMAVITHFR